MARSPHLRLMSARGRKRFRRSRAPNGLLVLGVAAIVIASVQFDWASLKITESELLAMAIAAGIVILVGALFPTGLALQLWHGFANAFPEKQSFRVRMPRVVDGDTIDDAALGVRYRFANIDAPETGDNARCNRERTRGEGASAFVEREVRRAKLVSVRRTFRTDQYGRRVAFVQVDGRDLGEMLVRAGFARPWRGYRRKWCGPEGGLAKIAEAGGLAHACSACGANRPAAPEQ